MLFNVLPIVPLPGKCTASLSFWYNRQEYVVGLEAASSRTIFSTDNIRHVFLQYSLNSGAFSYSIDRACNNKDDCARDLIENMFTELSQRDFNYSGIIDEVLPLILGSPLTPDKPVLNCYDSKQNDRQCGTSTASGSCIISEKLSEKRISTECDTKMEAGNTYISIYNSDDGYAIFDVHCNRSLCNARSTLQTAKELMFKHNITITPDGRLDGSRLIMSTFLIAIMIFLLLSNQF